jgi:hypothetical protein
MIERAISSASTQQKARKMNGPNLSRIELLRKKCGDSASPKSAQQVGQADNRHPEDCQHRQRQQGLSYQVVA